MGDTNYVHLIESNKNLQIQQINLIIITVDMSRPGKMFLELEKWANVVKKLYENCDKQYKMKSMFVLCACLLGVTNSM